MSSCPTRLCGKTRNSFPSPQSTCLAFPVPVYFEATHSACDLSGCSVKVKLQNCTRTRCNRGGWRLTWKSWNLCDHVVMSCNLSGWSPGCWRSGSRWPGWSWGTRWKLFDSFDESDEWGVNGWTGPFSIFLQTQHVLDCIVLIMEPTRTHHSVFMC